MSLQNQSINGSDVIIKPQEGTVDKIMNFIDDAVKFGRPRTKVVTIKLIREILTDGTYDKYNDYLVDNSFSPSPKNENWGIELAGYVKYNKDKNTLTVISKYINSDAEWEQLDDGLESMEPITGDDMAEFIAEGVFSGKINTKDELREYFRNAVVEVGQNFDKYINMSRLNNKIAEINGEKINFQK